MTWYLEWAATPDARSGRLLPILQIEKLVKAGLSGYTSVYQFTHTAAEAIGASGRSKGFKNFSPSSTTLIMDCDIGQEGALEVEARLQALGLEYTQYFSGSKGYHFYIPMTERLTGMYTPYSQKTWVVGNGFKGLVDLSLYRASSLLSAPGRIHPKTGKKKTFIKHVPGSPVCIPYVEPEQLMPEADFGDNPDAFIMAMTRLWGLCEQPEIGQRHLSIWGTSKICKEAGLDYDTCLGMMLFLNRNWKDSKLEDEVVAAVEQAYTRD